MIFAVILLGLVVQIGSFRYAGPYIERKSPVKSAIGGLLLRAVSYGALGVFAYFLTGLWFLLPVLIFYPLASGIAYSVYYTASNTMVFNTLSPRRNGSALGVLQRPCRSGNNGRLNYFGVCFILRRILHHVFDFCRLPWSFSLVTLIDGQRTGQRRNQHTNLRNKPARFLNNQKILCIRGFDSNSLGSHTE